MPLRSVRFLEQVTNLSVNRTAQPLDSLGRHFPPSEERDINGFKVEWNEVSSYCQIEIKKAAIRQTTGKENPAQLCEGTAGSQSRPRRPWCRRMLRPITRSLSGDEKLK